MEHGARGRPDDDVCAVRGSGERRRAALELDGVEEVRIRGDRLEECGAGESIVLHPECLIRQQSGLHDVGVHERLRGRRELTRGGDPRLLLGTVPLPGSLRRLDDGDGAGHERGGQEDGQSDDRAAREPSRALVLAHVLADEAVAVLAPHGGGDVGDALLEPRIGGPEAALLLEPAQVDPARLLVVGIDQDGGQAGRAFGVEPVRGPVPPQVAGGLDEQDRVRGLVFEPPPQFVRDVLRRRGRRAGEQDEPLRLPQSGLDRRPQRGVRRHAGVVAEDAGGP